MNLLDFPDEMILDICNRLDNTSLSSLIKSGSNTYKICKEILDQRKEDFQNLFSKVTKDIIDISNITYQLPEEQLEFYKKINDKAEVFITIRPGFNTKSGFVEVVQIIVPSESVDEPFPLHNFKNKSPGIRYKIFNISENNEIASKIARFLILHGYN